MRRVIRKGGKGKAVASVPKPSVAPPLACGEGSGSGAHDASNAAQCASESLVGRLVGESLSSSSIATLASPSQASDAAPVPAHPPAQAQPTLPTLPRVHASHGAVATFRQASTSKLACLPRFVDTGCSSAILNLVPGRTADAATHALYHAFLAAHTVIGARDALDVQKLVASEEAEVIDSFNNVASEDGSLPPRPVSVVLLLCGGSAVGSYALHTLNAFSHLNSCFHISEMRASVFAGADAAAYLEHVGARANPHSASVVVRWASSGDDAERSGARVVTHVHSFPELGLSGERICEELQECLFTMTKRFDAPFRPHIVKNLGKVPMDAWLLRRRDAAAAFFGFMRGRSSVTIAPLESDSDQAASGQLTDFNICVRFADRKAGAPVDHPSTFHGRLLGGHSHGAEVLRACIEASVHGQGLGAAILSSDPAIAAAERARLARLGLHTCAVQANGFELADRVTLYSTVGKIREPIQPPRSWIWQSNAAIVPIADVLENFAVLPCTLASVVPGAAAFRVASDQFFNIAATLYAEACCNNTPSTVAAPNDVGSCCEETVGDGIASIDDRTDILVAAAFGMRFDTARFTAGDAYTQTARCEETQALVDFLAACIEQFGVSIPLRDCVARAASAVRHYVTPVASEANRREMARLRRVADAALLLRARSPVQVTETLFAADKIDKFTTLVGLRRAVSVLLLKPTADEAEDRFVQLVEILRRIIKVQRCPHASQHACDVAMRAFTIASDTDGEFAVVKAIGVAIQALRSVCSSDGFLDFVCIVKKETDVGFARITPGGAVVPITLGAAVDAAASGAGVVLVSGPRVTAFKR